jgi:hypothetical protein
LGTSWHRTPSGARLDSRGPGGAPAATFAATKKIVKTEKSSRGVQKNF